MTTPPMSTYEFVAQAETLLIYGIFLFLTGLAQLAVTLIDRYILLHSSKNVNQFTLLNFLPTSLSVVDLHLWYIYPSAAMVNLHCCSSNQWGKVNRSSQIRTQRAGRNVNDQRAGKTSNQFQETFIIWTVWHWNSLARRTIFSLLLTSD